MLIREERTLDAQGTTTTWRALYMLQESVDRIGSIKFQPRHYNDVTLIYLKAC